MIAIDTNILVRYFTQDDEAQSKIATRLLERTLSNENPGFVSTLVLLELQWVLTNAYKVSPNLFLNVVEELLEAPNILVQSVSALRIALRTNANMFADVLIHETAKSINCAKTVTFDRQFARLDSVALLAGLSLEPIPPIKQTQSSAPCEPQSPAESRVRFCLAGVQICSP